MSDLTNTEKRQFEKLFDMGSGYVCDFSNRTFEDFFIDTVNINIYDEKYNKDSGSKANRLRSFWSIESNYLTAKLLKAMLEHWKTEKTTLSDFNFDNTQQPEYNQPLHDACLKIVERLEKNTPVEDINVLDQFNNRDQNYDLLIDSIKESIYKDQANQAIDRLHTFIVKYIRQLSDKHEIEYTREIPLHSLFGGYIKFLQAQNMIESEMTIRIMKSSISIMEAFNTVRNQQSLAHDNEVLNRNESILIFNNIANLVKFIEQVEKDHQQNTELNSSKYENEEDIKIEDIPF